jgi:hypothetical protein
MKVIALAPFAHIQNFEPAFSRCALRRRVFVNRPLVN